MMVLQLNDGRAVTMDEDDTRYFCELVLQYMGEDAGRYLSKYMEHPDNILNRIKGIYKRCRNSYHDIDTVEYDLKKKLDNKTIDELELKKIDNDLSLALDELDGIGDELFNLCLDYGIML